MIRFLSRLLLLVCGCAFVFNGEAQQPKLMLPIGHTSAVWNASFSPNNKMLVTASSDGTAKIWDAATGTLLANLKGHTDWLLSASFSPDGNKIVTASKDGTAKIWDAQNGALLNNLEGHTSQVATACFSDDGKKIVTASWDYTAKIWDAQTGALLIDLKGHTREVNSACFSPDGKKIVTASFDKTAKIWDAATGTLLNNLPANTDGISSATFSPDGKKIVMASGDGNDAKVWDATNGTLLADLKGHTGYVYSATFSGDGNKIVTASLDHTAKLWDAAKGTLLSDLKHMDEIRDAAFSPDNNKIVTASLDNTAKIWDAKTGALLATLPHAGPINSAKFSPDGKMIVTASDDGTAKVWDATNGELISELKGLTYYVVTASYSPDGKKIVTASSDNTAKIWDATNGGLLANLKGHTNLLTGASFSPDGKKIVTSSEDSTAKIWDAQSGLLLVNLIGHTYRVMSACFSSDGKKVVTASFDRTAKIWDATTGALLKDLKKHTSGVTGACFSPDGKKIVTSSADNTAKIWDATKGTLLVDFKEHTGRVNGASFSPDGKKIVTAAGDNTAIIWNATTGAVLAELVHPDLKHKNYRVPSWVISASFSPDGKKVVTAANEGTAKIWDATSGALIADLKGHTGDVLSASFSPDNKKILTGSKDNTAKIWDAASGALLADLKGHDDYINSAKFSPDGKKIITSSPDNTCKIWDADKGALRYTFFTISEKDYLIIDTDNQYDGTAPARKLLYFTCGTEVIQLQQLKDKLWVPGLAERINKGETINASKLSELDICGLTPLVNPIENKTGYQFYITPQRGGLGETILYVNGIETKKYSIEQLKKVANGYELLVSKDELQQYFIAGKDNAVSVKAYTKENDIASRGASVTEDATAKATIPPSLYAVVIGVSDYKGDELDLKYAAKDAGDISNAVSLSASKLLGKAHVFMYNLNTGPTRDILPEKKSIKEVFTEIGKKATANDILMVFFAGHGVVEGEKKQFYFLTADASVSSITPTGVKDVGISTEELMDWIKPANIKAQKRILILDACHSGSAINQIVNIGNDQGFLAARSDDKAEEIKQIDKLNEKAGLYILAASASNQSAYEMGRYSQGLLTYALLKVIREHPEVLEQNKYLNVSSWFNEAVKIVTDIVRETNLRQEPQLITTTNFNIGIVDGEVLAKISVPGEKPLFTAGNFQNSAVIDDDLGLTGYINQSLGNIAARGAESKIAFINSPAVPGAWLLIGRYEVKGDEVMVKVNMKHNNASSNRFEITGRKSNLEELAERLVNTATQWIEKNK